MSAGAASFNRARSVFEDLVEASAAERQARLEGLRAVEPDLATQVKALLDADLEAGGELEGRLDQPVGRFASDLVEEWLAGEQMPARVGPYRIVSLLGRGGMGEVFLAERDDGQFEQRVALKRMRRGLDSAEIVRRFYRERQILARLEHPNIARLLDGGLADDGRPYFALEHVVGQSILAYATAHQLGLETRLRLLITACRAVEAAHRQLIVHRDLKPAHILVTDEGTVKLLDFGIAKLLEEELGPEGATALEHRALTPGYAAPEQILGEPVTTTTDVYALGVVLYELLTGQLPHRREARTLSELVSKVQAETVERPSAALRRLAGRDDLEARQRARRLSGDLDNILSRALKRDPERRYSSAGALADDLERHLAGRPVKARPDTLSYRAAKFIGRHRWAMAAGLLATVALFAALVLALVEGRRATAAARLAERHAEEARAQVRRTERVKQFLFAVFSEANPMRRQREEPLSPTELVRLGVRKAKTELVDEPLLEAEVMGDFSALLAGLDERDEARALAEEALVKARSNEPIAGAVTAKVLHHLAGMLTNWHQFERARALLDEELAIHARLGRGDSLETTQAKATLMLTFGLEGRFEEALATLREVLPGLERHLGTEHPETVVQHLSLAELLRVTGQLEEAERELRWALERLVAAHGPGHLKVALARLNLASLVEQSGRLAEAEGLYEEAAALLLAASGERDDAFLHSRIVLARVERELGKLAEARAHLHEALAVRQAQGDFRAGIVEIHLGWCWLAADEPELAARAFAAGRRTLAAAGRGDNVSADLAALGLGVLEIEAEHLRPAAAWIEPAARRLLAGSEPTGEERLFALRFLGELERAQGQAESAAARHREALELARRRYRGFHPAIAELAWQLAADLAAQGSQAARREAGALLAEARRNFTSLHPSHPRLRRVREAEQALGGRQ